MAEILAVALEAWIIQDGTYPDVKRGEPAAFPLEVGGTLEIVEPRALPSMALRRIDEARYEALYEVTAPVVHVGPKWWVLDAGVLMFCRRKPPQPATVGSWWTGLIDLYVDTSFYAHLSREPGAPALIYDWMIERIEMLTGPFIVMEAGVRTRDPARSAWKDIAETHARTDDDGNGYYMLHCRRLDGAPRRTL